jgi:hypothetical protein
VAKRESERISGKFSGSRAFRQTMTSPHDDSQSPDDFDGKDKDDVEGGIVGGFAFFLSLSLLLPTGLLFFVLAVRQIREADAKIAFAFLGSCVFGALLAHSMIQGHISVLLHEFKHALISNLVGNKNKKMLVNKNSGHLVYAYTKRTAHFNAFIALAPYIVPLMTFVAVLLSVAIAPGDTLMAVIIIGLGYGADILLNARDISPVQTDISLIRGGYGIGLLYILAWNLVTAALVLAWAFQGSAGITELFAAVSKLFIALYFHLSGTTPGE